MDKEVKVIALIRKNATGEIREYKTECWLFDDSSGEIDAYNWSEGGFSCDCNRALFFQRTKGEKEDWKAPCGDELYSVNLKDPKTGEIFYREYEVS